MEPVIAAVEVVYPPHYYPQSEVTAMMREHVWTDVGPEQLRRFEALHKKVNVQGRHLALPLAEYANLDGFEGRNDLWIEGATELGTEALEGLLHRMGLGAPEISLLATTTVTGIAVPSLDALLMNRLPFSPQMKRLPLFGLGCLGGVAGVARVADYLRGHPKQAAILLAVELCSLTLQPDDLSIANAIATGLFGDGAGAVLLLGAEHPLVSPMMPRIPANGSVFFQDTERVMGWDVTDTGFQIVLSPDVPDIAAREVGPAVDSFLADAGLARDDIARWVAHPGGPAVIEALEKGLELPAGTLRESHKSLAHVGNLSSVSVLLLLQEALREPPTAGSYGLMLAMGPAFCAELALLHWDGADEA